MTDSGKDFVFWSTAFVPSGFCTDSMLTAGGTFAPFAASTPSCVAFAPSERSAMM